VTNVLYGKGKEKEETKDLTTKSLAFQGI